jgi:hypothetical protein
VKVWWAVLVGVLAFFPVPAPAATDASSAAREVAAKAAGFAGGGAALSISYRNLSSLGPAELAQVRAAFEASLLQVGAHLGDSGAAGVLITISESTSEYLLVGEAHSGDERQVWLAGWPRAASGRGAPGAAPFGPTVSLDRKLVWEQDEPILDVAFPAGRMLVLSPSKLTLFEWAAGVPEGGPWQPRQSLPLSPVRPWPRDLRGHLRVRGAAFQAFLPGMICNGAAGPAEGRAALTMDCRESEEPWVVESGGRALLLGAFTADRNYFSGRVVAQNGTAKSIAPFFSAAAVEERGQTVWLLALTDGRAQLFDGGLNPLAGTGLPAWGSDIAGIDARCGPSSQVLATRSGDATEADAIQSYSFTAGAGASSAAPVSAPISFPGPVTALWSVGGSSAVAVARDLATGRYSAYVLTVACGS